MACGLLLEAEWEGIARLRTQDVKDTVHVKDEVRLQVMLLPLLPDAAMRALLRETLKAAGWDEQADGSLRRVSGGIEATLTPDASEVVVRAEAKLEVTARGSARVEDDNEKKANREALAAAEKALEGVKAAAEAKLKTETLGAIAAAEPGIRVELQTSLNKVYRQALEEKARQMGEVEAIQEKGDDRGSYEVTITVRA